MQRHNRMVAPIVVMLIAMTVGCDEEENKRLAAMAERHLERQAEQNRQMSELHGEVAEGSRRLVEADAKAREEIVALHRDVQAERTEIGRQRDVLEGERRDFAAKRHLDPIIAAAITSVGLLLACLLPLVLCAYLLHGRAEPVDDQAVVEILLEDLVADTPLLLPSGGRRRKIGFRDDTGTPQLPDESDHTGSSN